ncbi:tetratricopeptide repeat protein [Marinobacter sp.]|uniref:tetratricopeptide repeat protein n=1 Tax=Marinobacter sp. TaxID=50741 RepID=UPI002B462974|nr:tetratricopeptide repeat protein [Marinobacter sp.]HKK55627.1 tetratricopeptide repeat protein [Marinobacter sp.]
MSWIESLMRTAVALALMAWLAGCANMAPTPEDTALAREQARQELLEQNFGQAVDAMENGSHEVARRQFQALHESHPERTGPLANLGILALQAGDQGQAKARFEEVVALDAGHAPALNHLGVIARENGEFARAEAYYREALAAEPDYLPAMMNLAILLDIYLGRPGDALPLYEQYQSMVEEPNPRLKDWIFDARNRS